MKALKDWSIVKALVTAWKWCYAEIGTALSLLKSPDKTKYSAKRVIALALVADALLSGLPNDLWKFLVFAAKLAVAGVLVLIAAVTKT